MASSFASASTISQRTAVARICLSCDRDVSETCQCATRGTSKRTWRSQAPARFRFLKRPNILKRPEKKACQNPESITNLTNCQASVRSKDFSILMYACADWAELESCLGRWFPCRLKYCAQKHQPESQAWGPCRSPRRQTWSTKKGNTWKHLETKKETWKDQGPRYTTNASGSLRHPHVGSHQEWAKLCPFSAFHGFPVRQGQWTPVKRVSRRRKDW